MHKTQLVDLLREYGDATINYKSPVSNKFKYVVATICFDTPHIKSKHNRAQETEDTVLVFCWDTDAFKLIKPDQVTSVVPLSKELRNV